MNVLETYLQKVAYKFPKGYFDIDDPKDRDLLVELVGYNIFEQEDVVTPKGEVESGQEKQQEQVPNDKARILQLIKDSEISPEVAEQIEKLLATSTYKPQILSYIQSKGFTADKFKVGDSAVEYIFKKLADSEVDNFLQYTQSPSSLSDLPDAGNFANELGLPRKLITDLVAIEPGQDRGGSSIGKGEVFLGLIFDDVDNRDGGGDLNWNGNNFEIKGEGGRLGQQGGRAGGASAIESIANGIIADDKIDEFLNSKVAKSMTYSLPKIIEIAKQQGQEAIALKKIQRVIDQIYYNKGFATQYFKSASDLENPADVKKSITKILAHGYAVKNNVDYFLFFDRDTNYRIMDLKDIDSIIDKELLNTTVKDATLGYNWNNPYPNMTFKRA